MDGGGRTTDRDVDAEMLTVQRLRRHPLSTLSLAYSMLDSLLDILSSPSRTIRRLPFVVSIPPHAPACATRTRSSFIVSLV